MSIETNPQTTERRDDDFGTPPQSRVEQVLMNEQIKPQSRIEKLILEGGGGGGGTSDYNQLNHKPSINGVPLSGNKTSLELNLVQAEVGKGLSTNDYTTAEKTKVAGLTNDYTNHTNKPSINSVTLVGNKSLSDLGIEWVWRGTRSQYEAAAASIPPNTFVNITDEPDMDTVPTQGSLNPVTSNGLWMELSKLKVINENPENHNGIYRGKDLTNIYTIEQIYERVHDGSFEDLYLGDYFTVNISTDLYTRFTGSAFESGVTYYEMGGTVIARTWTETQDETPQSGKVYATKQVVTEDVDLMIAHFDYYLNTGDTAVTDHHVILIPKLSGFMYGAKMNTTSSTTAGGYAGCDMHQITLPCYAKSLKIALGNHLLSHRTWLTTTVNESTPSMAGAGLTGAASAATWSSADLCLMNENQCFGSSMLAGSWFDGGIDNEKFAIFNFIEPMGSDRYAFWLRTIVSATYFACDTARGSVTPNNANAMSKVRPIILFG